LGGLLIALFAGWRISRAASMEEMGLGDGAAYEIWRFVLRYIAPVGVVLIFLNVLGII